MEVSLVRSSPSSFAVLNSLTDCLGEDDSLHLLELQDFQVVNPHSDIRHNIVGQISWQNLTTWF